MSTEITELEIKRGRHCLQLQKVESGPLLQSVAGGAFSFFYRVKVDGEMRTFTSDPEVARSVWRGAHRWMFTGSVASTPVAA